MKETLKTLLEGTKHYVDSKFRKSRGDWNQNDKSADNYIKNRPFYTSDPIETVILEETIYDGFERYDEGIYGYELETNIELSIGVNYTVIFDGITYENLICFDYDGATIGSTLGDFSDYPFDICTYYDGDVIYLNIITNSTDTSHSISIRSYIAEVNHLDPKYIKDMYYDNGNVVTELVPKQSITGFSVYNGTIYTVEKPFVLNPVKDATYIVSWDDTEYTLKCESQDGQIYIGNTNYVDMQPGGDIPFAIIPIVVERMVVIATESTAESHTIGVVEIKRDLKQLDAKYLPITEERYNNVFEAYVNNNDVYDDDTFKMILGQSQITIDDQSEIIEFIDDGDYSYANGSSYYIETWDGGLYFNFYDGESHNVKIEKYNLVIKEEHLPDNIGVQSDWNRNDPEAPDYVKNRPLYTEIVPERTVFEDHIEYTKTSSIPYPYDCSIPVGTIMDQYIDDQLLCSLQIAYDAESEYLYASDGRIHVVFDVNNNYVSVSNYWGTGTIKIIVREFENVQILDEKYIPDTLKIGYAGSDYCSEIFNDYTHNVSSGDYSHAEGSRTIATGDYSHAEGSKTTASGNASHAEGTSTASGDYSHAEGSSTASGDYSHAEGSSTDAIGLVSHAEGANTKAMGQYSHAEGFVTKALGDSSHAEGNNTIAASDAQHVQGKFNIEDINDKYAHIVGNGSGINDRSNAHTVDWEGNAWFAGDIYLGGTGQDDPNAVNIRNLIGTGNGGSGGSSVFTVTITGDEENGYSADKTFDEIVEANSSGKNVVAKWNYDGADFVLYLNAIFDNESIVFSYHRIMEVGQQEGLNLHITADGLIQVEWKQFNMYFDEYVKLNTTDKTVLGAINELHSKFGDIESICDEVIALQNSYIQGT